VGRVLSSWPDRAIGAIAARQRTLVTRKQLVRLGVGRGAIDHALARGRLYIIHTGVYSLVPRAALPPLARELAAVLACGEGAVLSHHSAAAVWGIRPPATGAVEVTVTTGQAGRRRKGICVHRAKTLGPRDIRSHRGIPITSPARTLFDIAPSLGDREFERAFDEALVARRLITRAAVRALLAANPRRPGSGRLRDLIEPGRNSSITKSEAENRMLALVRRARLPMPETDVKIGPWEVDFLWRRERVAVEVDGHDFHSSRAALERDHRKDADLQHRGLFVLRFSGREVKREPVAVLAAVVTALARRNPGQPHE
jgi:very-short-patch-repair endonuclease